MSSTLKASISMLSIGYILNGSLAALGLRREADITLTILFMISLVLSSIEWRGAVVIFISGASVGFLMEYLGLSFGIPFGGYRYLAFREASLMGVPLPIIITWGTYLYTSYLASSMVTSRSLRSLFTSLLMVVLDLAVDPVMVSLGLWEWQSRGPWFGVPLTNYLGWFITSLLALLLYYLLAVDLRPCGWPAAIPYLTSFLPLMAVSRPETMLAVIISLLMALITLATELALARKS